MLVVRDWVQHYESAQSRVVTKLSWVRVPNSHDTQGFCRLMAQPDNMALFGAFVLIVQVASKCAERGILTDSKGRALDAYDIAAQCRGNAGVIQRAIEVLSDEKIGWMVECPTLEQARAASGRATGAAEAGRTQRYQRCDTGYERDAEKHQPRDTEERREEEKRREKKRASERSGEPVAEAPPARAPAVPERALIEAIWRAMRRQPRFARVDRGMAERIAIVGLAECAKLDVSPEEFLRCADHIVENAYRDWMKKPALYEQTVPEEIRNSIAVQDQEVA